MFSVEGNIKERICFANLSTVLAAMLQHYMKLGIDMELQVEQVISELSKIDNATENVINSSTEEKDEYMKKIQQEKEAFDSNLDHKLQEHLNEYRQKLTQDNAQVLSNQRAETEDIINNLEASFKKMHTSIAMNILTELTKE